MILTLYCLILFCMHPAITDDDIRDYDIHKLLNLFKNLMEYRPADVSDEDVTFFLNTRNVTNLQIALSSNESIDLSKNTKFVIHGWIDNHNRSWYHQLTEDYLKIGDFNIIQVDWWRVAQSFYLSSAQNTKLIGALIAKFIINYNFEPKKVHLIGHSLGAHIAGFAAQTVFNKTSVKIQRITALDPAGPAFRNFFSQNENRLDSGDANIVDAIHTDGGFFGIYRPIGTFDIYINGGVRIQPDCINITDFSKPGELFEDTYCSHTRSYVRFIELINNVKYSCHKCDSWSKYFLGLCDSNELYVFGAEDINESMTGVCFVNTAKKN